MVLDQETGQIDIRDGDDFVCPNCACEFRIRHQGDPDRMERNAPFTCCCGTTMRKEVRPESNT